MKVLGLVHQYIPERSAGAETHIHSMLRALADRGHEVNVVLSRQDGPAYVLDGVNVWPLVDIKADPFQWIPGADLIISHLENTTRAVVLGHYNQVPVCIVHHNDFEQTRTQLELPSSRTDLIVVNSQWMDESLSRWAADRLIQLPPRAIVRPGVAVAEYNTDRAVLGYVTLVNLRRRDATSSDNGLTKGGETFRAIAEAMPKTQFLGITGIYGTQQELDDLPNVRVLPHVPHDEMAVTVYAATRILLVPSSYESWGRVAAEALCSGIPVIATPTPGLIECLGDAGIFVKPDDIGGWVDAIRALSNAKNYSAAFKRARARARELEQIGAEDLARFVDAVETTVAQGGFTPFPLEAFSA
jgi:glycosyltransferase involved in cell wall biosynthesis